MHNKILGLSMKLQILMRSEQGQDLVEYGLLASLIAVALIAGINPIASAVNKVFTNISSSLA